MDYKIIDFDVFGDVDGWLVSIENSKKIPFDIQRVFYIFDTKTDVVRGKHANRKSEFVLITLHGSCMVKIKDKDGEKNILLDSRSRGLWLDKMVWKEMYDFSQDAVLLVLSNELYDRDEYIMNYDEFLKLKYND